MQTQTLKSACYQQATQAMQRMLLGIEAATGVLAEAEALAEALREGGLYDATAMANTAETGQVTCWVWVGLATEAKIMAAIDAAGLSVISVSRRDGDRINDAQAEHLTIQLTDFSPEIVTTFYRYDLREAA